MKEHLKYIGANIRVARKSQNLTLEILSERVGISTSFLGLVERGESSLSIETLISVCKALGVSADSIILNQSPPPAPSLIEKKDALIALLNNTTDEELSFLIDFIRLYRRRTKISDDV